MSKLFTRICPRCGSIDITSSTGRYALEAEVYVYNCRNCSYEGFIPEVEISKIKSFRKNIIEKSCE